MARNESTAWWGLCLAAAWLTAGCSPPSASVRGTVSVGGRLLTGGQVSFVPANGNAVTADIGPDGSYHLDGLPAAEMMVLVTGPPPPPQGNEGLKAKLSAGPVPAPPAAAGPEVPSKYQAVATSDLKHTLQPGPNVYNINLAR